MIITLVRYFRDADAADQSERRVLRQIERRTLMIIIIMIITVIMIVIDNDVCIYA